MNVRNWVCSDDDGDNADGGDEDDEHRQSWLLCHT